MTANDGESGVFAEDDVVFYNHFGLIFASFTTKFGQCKSESEFLKYINHNFS